MELRHVYQALWNPTTVELHRDIDNDNRAKERPLLGGVTKIPLAASNPGKVVTDRP